MSALAMLKVKHSLLTFLDFVYINASDFDPEVHTIIPEPGSEPTSTPVTDPVAVIKADEPTVKAAEPAPAEATPAQAVQEADAAEDALNFGKKRRTPNS
jgi:hypothetical protein